jgi:uncharacterized membrane protein required for colicin V production
MLSILLFAALGATFDIGANLTGVLLALLNLVSSIVAAGAAVQARKAIADVKHETTPNNGSTLRDAIDSAVRTVTSLHVAQTGVLPPPAPPPPPPGGGGAGPGR